MSTVGAFATGLAETDCPSEAGLVSVKALLWNAYVSDGRLCEHVLRLWLESEDGDQMRRRSVIGLAAALATAKISLAICGAATGEESKPAAPSRESARSFPPDTTPYVRPAIPEDRVNTPLTPP